MAKRKLERYTVDINDQAYLQQCYTSCYPGGSGPLSMQRIICAIIESIAVEKGWELVRPERTKTNDTMMFRMITGRAQ